MQSVRFIHRAPCRASLSEEAKEAGVCVKLLNDTRGQECAERHTYVRHVGETGWREEDLLGWTRRQLAKIRNKSVSQPLHESQRCSVNTGWDA